MLTHSSGIPQSAGVNTGKQQRDQHGVMFSAKKVQLTDLGFDKSKKNPIHFKLDKHDLSSLNQVAVIQKEKEKPFWQPEFMFSVPLSEGLPMFLFQGKFPIPTRPDETFMYCMTPSPKNPHREVKVRVKI